MNLFIIFLLIASATASLDWQITPIGNSDNPPVLSTVKFRVMLNDVEQTTGKLAMVDSEGVIRGLAESPIKEAEFLGGKYYFAPLNFKSQSEGTVYNIMFTPDDVVSYTLSDTYSFVSNDPAKTEIHINALNWKVTPITTSSSPPVLSTVKFRVMLDNVEQTTGKLAMVDSEGVIRGLAESPIQEADFLGGKYYFAPLNFKSESEGTVYNIMFTPDNEVSYTSSVTYSFVTNDPAKTEINFITPELKWQITPITNSSSPPVLSTVKFRVLLDNVEQTTGKLAMVDSEGVIRGLAESPIKEAEFLGGKYYFAPLNFKSESEGTVYNIMFTPDDIVAYTFSDTYSFVTNDPAKIEIEHETVVCNYSVGLVQSDSYPRLDLSIEECEAFASENGLQYSGTRKQNDEIQLLDKKGIPFGCYASGQKVYYGLKDNPMVISAKCDFDPNSFDLTVETHLCDLNVPCDQPGYPECTHTCEYSYNRPCRWVNDPCVNNADCDTRLECSGGVCSVPINTTEQPAGSPCTLDEHCAVVPGAYQNKRDCDSNYHVCSSNEVSIGQGLYYGGASGFGWDLHCQAKLSEVPKTSGGCIEKTCTPDKCLGEWNSGVCSNGELYADFNGTCEHNVKADCLGDIGESCTAKEHCKSDLDCYQWNDNNVCRIPIGEVCTSNDECITDYCGDGICSWDDCSNDANNAEFCTCGLTECKTGQICTSGSCKFPAPDIPCDEASGYFMEASIVTSDTYPRMDLNKSECETWAAKHGYTFDDLDVSGTVPDGCFIYNSKVGYTEPNATRQSGKCQISNGGCIEYYECSVNCTGYWGNWSRCEFGVSTKPFITTISPVGFGSSCPADETKQCLGELHDSCSTTDQCKFTLDCFNETECRYEARTICTNNNECATDYCLDGVCDYTDCPSDVLQEDSILKRDTFCKCNGSSTTPAPSSPFLTHICDGSPLVGGCTGGPCGWVDDSCSVDTDCDIRLECSGGTCTVPSGTTGQANGEPCSEDSQCEGNYCPTSSKSCYGGISWGYGGASGMGWEMHCPCSGDGCNAGPSSIPQCKIGQSCTSGVCEYPAPDITCNEPEYLEASIVHTNTYPRMDLNRSECEQWANDHGKTFFQSTSSLLENDVAPEGCIISYYNMAYNEPDDTRQSFTCEFPNGGCVQYDACSVDCEGYWGDYGTCNYGIKKRYWQETLTKAGPMGSCDYSDGQEDSSGCTQPLGTRCHYNQHCASGYCKMGQYYIRTCAEITDCVGDWGAWDACRNGERERRYVVTTPADGPGAVQCPYTAGQKETETCLGVIDDVCSDNSHCETNYCKPCDVGDYNCYTRYCKPEPIHCAGTWSEFTDCYAGSKNRTFTITTHPEHEGNACPTSPNIVNCKGPVGAFCEQNSHCQDDNCKSNTCEPPVDCVGSWSEMTACSNGEQSKTFTITTPSEGTGEPCPDVLFTQSCLGDVGDTCNSHSHCTSLNCKLNKCEPPVDCVGSWNDWSACTNAQRTRDFIVTTAAEGTGQACPASPETESCVGGIGDTCSDDYHCEPKNCHENQCAELVDCVGSWSDWGACTNGYENRVYTQTTFAQGIGAVQCPHPHNENEARVCEGEVGDSCALDSHCTTDYCHGTTLKCRLKPVDCEGTWSEYGECSDGQKSRTFTVTTAAANDGQACPTSPESTSCTGNIGDQCSQNSHCASNFCKNGNCATQVDCQSHWDTWSECNYGSRSRIFLVDVAAEGPDAIQCEQAHYYVEDGTCKGENRADCSSNSECLSDYCHFLIYCDTKPVDCQGTWSAYSVCSDGQKSRTFTVTTEAAGTGQACPASPQTTACTGDIGDQCSQNSHCSSNYCNNGNCATQATTTQAPTTTLAPTTTQAPTIDMTWDLKAKWNLVSFNVKPSDISDPLTSINIDNLQGCTDIDCTNGGDYIILKDGKNVKFYDLGPDAYGGAGDKKWLSLSNPMDTFNAKFKEFVEKGVAFRYYTPVAKTETINGAKFDSITYDFKMGVNWVGLVGQDEISYNQNDILDSLFLDKSDATVGDTIVHRDGGNAKFYDEGPTEYGGQLQRKWFSFAGSTFTLKPGEGFYIYKHADLEITKTN